MMDKRQASSFYPHFAIEERPTIDQFVGLFNRLLFTGQAFLTDFLDPRQRQIMETIAGGEAIVQAFGGYEEAEKCRLYISLNGRTCAQMTTRFSFLKLNTRKNLPVSATARFWAAWPIPG